MYTASLKLNSPSLNIIPFPSHTVRATCLHLDTTAEAGRDLQQASRRIGASRRCLRNSTKCQYHHGLPQRVLRALDAAGTNFFGVTTVVSESLESLKRFSKLHIRNIVITNQPYFFSMPIVGIFIYPIAKNGLCAC